MTHIALSKPYIDDEIRQGVLAALNSGRYILGDTCKQFETQFAQYFSTKHAVLTSSGTSAIFLSLLALGVKQGDEIIVPAHTAFPTIEPIYHLGAVPVFVEIDEHSFTLDPQQFDKLVTPKTKGILPVHLYGHAAPLDAVFSFAKKHNLFVLEDACQAHGAELNGKKCGSMGITGCFSFYPSKNMTVAGDGGMVITNDDALAKKIRLLRNHGRESRYDHEDVGYNLRFNEMNAAVGLVQLRHLDDFVAKRRALAELYRKHLVLVKEIILPTEVFGKHSYHLFVIRTSRRDQLKEFLAQHGIETEIHYPIAMHQQGGTKKVFSALKRVLPSLPVTEKICREILSLPMHPQLTEEDVKYVAETISSFFKS